MNREKYLKMCFDQALNDLDDYQLRVEKALEFIKSFEYYIPENDKEELIRILEGDDNDES